MGWMWRKGVSVGKKIIAACLVVTTAPFVIPPLAVAATIALISSLPYCFLLASYVCAEKVMRILLPATAFTERSDKMVPLPNKISHGDGGDVYYEGTAREAISEPVLVETGEDGATAIAFWEEGGTPLRVIITEDEEMTKESKSLLDSIREEDRTNKQSLDRGIYEKGMEEEGDKDKIRVRHEDDEARKNQVSDTRHEGEHESMIAEASKGKDMEKSLNAMKALHSEEEIWAKMEALRNIVGYSVARSTTYSEELKALYTFTGVELPTSMSSSDEDEDTVQVSERLSFLMSVIGVK